MMVRTAAPERMLSDVERELLERLATAEPERSDQFLGMIHKRAGKWTWEYRTITAPRMYDTKRETIEAFGRFVELLEGYARIEQERGYHVERRDG